MKKFQKAFGWLGFFVALGWIYVIANEVVAILQVGVGLLKNPRSVIYYPAGIRNCDED